MDKLIRAIASVVLVVSFFAAVVMWIGWYAEGDGRTVRPPWWTAHRALIATGAFVASLAWFVWADWFRRDRAVDLLALVSSKYFARGGFAFAPIVHVEGGVCRVGVVFQNAYERPCRAKVRLRPISGTGWTLIGLPEGHPAGIATVLLEIECPGAAYGIADAAWAIPESMAGKDVRVEITADAEFPQGGGRQMRFREGMEVGGVENTSLQSVTTAALAITGHITIHRPALADITLPLSAAAAAADSRTRVAVLWEPGSAPPDASAVPAPVPFGQG